MGFQINYGGFAFAVPGDVVDHYIRLADGDKLKVLLFVLRHASENVTADAAADYLHIAKEQAEEALQFWEQADVLRQGSTQQGTAFAFSPAVTAVQQEKAVEVPVSDSRIGTQKSSKECRLDPSEIAAEINKSDNLNDLFTIAENYLARPVNYSEQRSLIWMHQYLNIPCEIIAMLLQYCVSNNIFSVSYVESIAVRFQADGILSIQEAETELQRMSHAHTFTNEIRRIFELSHSPTTKQKAYIEKWQKSGYDLKLIGYACEKCLDAKKKVEFPYINAILERWAKESITTLEQAQNQPQPAKKNPKFPKPASQEELDKMNKYLSLVNRFKEDDTNE